jgi:hypothetical protein
MPHGLKTKKKYVDTIQSQKKQIPFQPKKQQKGEASRSAPL